MDSFLVTLPRAMQDVDLADTYAAYREKTKTWAIARMVSSSISLIASITLVWIIFRSHSGLSTPLNRLLLGLCIADIVSSFASALSTLMVPRDVDYMIWNAQGNIATCDAQGFLIGAGAGAGVMYNSSICLYALAIVKYKKSDEYIRQKIEPYIHGSAIVFPVAGCIIVLAMQIFNEADAHCWAYQYNPPHCKGYEDGVVPDGYEVPCGRGPYGKLLLWLGVMPLAFCAPLAMIVSMTMTYRTVLKMEKKMAKYGVGGLRNNLGNVRVQTGGNNLSEESTSSKTRMSNLSSKLKSSFGYLRLSRSTQQPASRSNSTGSQSREVLYKGFAYTFGYFAAWSYNIIIIVLALFGNEPPYTISLLNSIFGPLQGLFNFLIIIYPRVMSAKRSKKDNLSWYQAFIKALLSRGGKKRAKPSLSSDRKKKIKKKKQAPVAEEEKCEVQDGRQKTFTGLSSSYNTASYVSHTNYSSLKDSVSSNTNDHHKSQSTIMGVEKLDERTCDKLDEDKIVEEYVGENLDDVNCEMKAKLAKDDIYENKKETGKEISTVAIDGSFKERGQCIEEGEEDERVADEAEGVELGNSTEGHQDLESGLSETADGTTVTDK